MSALAINHNMLAVNTANNLTRHYSDLAVSTKRLSSGLRINGAADDAAGLAIRELMRADIAALHQGMRNVNDAISMLQTFDGALAVIDEKLIRMKELAEQAATGTYDSTQRLMIDSEFQAMGAEINRIARATDFNGVKLIDGDFEEPAVEIEAPDGKTYAVSMNGSFVDAWPGSSASINGGWDTSGITDPSALVGKHTITITNDSIPRIGNNFLLVTPQGGNTNVPPGTTLNIAYDGNGGWTVNGTAAMFGNDRGFFWSSGGIAITTTLANAADGSPATMPAQAVTSTWTAPMTTPSFSSNMGTVNATLNGNTLDMVVDLGGGNTISQSWNIANGPDTAVSSVTINLNVRDTTQKPDAGEDGKIPDDVVKIHFGTGNDSAEDYYYVHKRDATLKGLGLEGVDIKTQAKAQEALVQVNDAIVAKDKIRAEFGATQNRFENTLTNLSTQAEMLQAAESRLSDADIAQEMTIFVRNQILTQSAVAMLAQANSMPQMVMRLIGA